MVYFSFYMDGRDFMNYFQKTRTYGSESATGQPTIMNEINMNNF